MRMREPRSLNDKENVSVFSLLRSVIECAVE
jgi:hypothetical protein